MARPGMRNSFRKRSPGVIRGVELPIPADFRCPITLELMKDPVTVSTGITYDRQSIETWLEGGNRTCPVTNLVLTGEELIPNHSIRRMIQDWCVDNKAYGIERIPTPKTPVSAAQVSDILLEIASASQRGDDASCCGLVAKIKVLAKESERNLRCIVSTGAGRALCASFHALATGLLHDSSNGVFEEILSALTSLFPLDEEASYYIRSPESLSLIISILESGDSAGKLNAVLVLKELVACNSQRIDAVAQTEGLIEALVKLIKEPISPQATKASLVATFYLVSSGENTASRFVELGLLSVLLDILVDSEKGMCEKALAILDGLFSSERGREEAYNHALTMPVLVKKMFRISDLATQFAVSALWKLCKSNKEGNAEECVVEALQVGAFQKLLLLLQVGCGEMTKDKATDLLKLMNNYREMVECIETMDFKGLKRPF